MALPFLESTAIAGQSAPTRLLIVGNPFGAHPDYFFPRDFGKNFTLSETLSSMDWVKDRMTVFSHTDHNMVSGHGREVAFLSGVLPKDAAAYPDKNMSIDQIIAREIGGSLRFPSLNIGPEGGVGMSWTASGTENAIIRDPRKLHEHLFVNLSADRKEARKVIIDRNKSILDTVADQYSVVKKQGSQRDAETMDRFETTVRELEQSFETRASWLETDKPSYDLSQNYPAGEIIDTAHDYRAIFDMVALAFETDLTRVATIAFPQNIDYQFIEGVNRSYHGCTHNGKSLDLTNELVAIESFQIEQLSRCMQKLDSIEEPNGQGTMLDNTVVLFGAGMGYGGTHSNRDLPIMVAGGGFQHAGHIDVSKNGEHMPLCNLYVRLMQRFGIERDQFNLSTGTFDFAEYAKA